MTAKSPAAAPYGAPRLLQYFPPQAINRCTPGLLVEQMHPFGADGEDALGHTECLGPGAVLPAWHGGDREPG